MSEETLSIRVKSSWASGNQKSLHDSVTLTPFTAHKRNEDGALTDMVKLDSCVLLCQPAEENGNQDVEPQHCSMSLKLEPSSSFVIASVIVVSEARKIEVYGAYNEYLMTVSSELLDEVGDTAVYSAEIDFTQLTQECTLKFARLRKPTEMWLFGVKVLWNIQNDTKVKSRLASSVNFETVDQRLNESQSQLSGRAESCRQFLKMYSLHCGKNSPQGFPDPMSLLSLIPAMSRQTVPPLSSSAQNLQSETDTAITSTISSGRHSCRESESSICHGCSQNIESILEKKLAAMENRIMEAFGEKVAALKEHQDRQMQSLFNLLKNAVSFDGVHNVKTNKEVTQTTQSDQDLKIDLAIRNLIGRNADFHKEESVYRRSTCDGNTDNILRNAFMALKLDSMFAETPQQSEVDSVATVQNIS